MPDLTDLQFAALVVVIFLALIAGGLYLFVRALDPLGNINEERL